jgi:hypothetical protein
MASVGKRSLFLLPVLLAATIASSGATPTTPTCDTTRGAQIHQAGAVPIATSTDVHPCLVETGFRAFEPTLGIGPDGALFVDAFTADPVRDAPAFPEVVRTTDHGTTWERVSPQLAGTNSHPTSEDPYLYVDKDTGRVFSIDLLPTIMCAEISFSDDAGTTWTTTVGGCRHADHETVFAGPPVTSHPSGYPNVVYYCSESDGASLYGLASACSKSLDGGLTWLPTGAPAFFDDPSAGPGDYGIPGNCGPPHGHGFVGRDGTVYLPRGWCGQPWLAISKDEGATWRRVRVAHNGMALTDAGIWEHEAGIVADAEGNLFYTWVGRDRLPYLAVSRDGGTTWSDPMMVAPPGVKETALPGIDVGPDGRVAIVYIGSTDSQGAPFIECPGLTDDPAGCATGLVNLSFAVRDDVNTRYRDVTWNGYITVSLDPMANAPTFISTSVNDPDNPLARGLCGPNPYRCEEGDFVDVVVGPDGTPWAAFVDGCVTACVHPSSDADKHGNANQGVVGRLAGIPSAH